MMYQAGMMLPFLNFMSVLDVCYAFCGTVLPLKKKQKHWKYVTKVSRFCIPLPAKRGNVIKNFTITG